MLPKPELRHYCRNPRCKLKLKAPVENIREAFCCRGCWRQFYDKHCMACEADMVRRSSTQRVHQKPGCRNEFEALKRHGVLGRFFPLTGNSSSGDGSASRNPINTGTFSGVASGARIIAGPALDPVSFRLACLPMDRATAARIRQTNRSYRDDDSRCEFKRHHAPLNLIGGNRSWPASFIPFSFNPPSVDSPAAEAPLESINV